MKNSGFRWWTYGWSCLTQFLTSVSVSFRYISSLIFINLWLKSLALTGSPHKSFIRLWWTEEATENAEPCGESASVVGKSQASGWTHWGSALPERPLEIDSSIPLSLCFPIYVRTGKEQLPHAADDRKMKRAKDLLATLPASKETPNRYNVPPCIQLLDSAKLY